MRIVKRAICIILAASCAFFTGCNSIVYNGNFKFKSFPPETVPAVEGKLDHLIEETSDEHNTDKYDIKGTDAFYILPQHENRPDHVIDFKVLDYTQEQGFIYAYLTPYYGQEAGDGLAGAGKEGTAPETRTDSTDSSSCMMNVLVLMSYHPETRKYRVFYSNTVDASKTEEIAVREEGGEELTASAHNTTVMANRLVREQQYFIFDGKTAYLYDKEGNELFHKDYSVLIAQESLRLKEKAGNELRKTKSASEVQNMIDGAEVSVSDVQMDGFYYVYIPITVELGDADSTEADHREELYEDDISEEEIENTVFTTVIACYDMNIGGPDAQVVFHSENTAWEAQKDYWRELHREGGEFEGDSDVFTDQEAAEAYLERYSMNHIKSGMVGNIPDAFSAFSNRETGIEFAAVSDLFSFELWKMTADNQWNGEVWKGTMGRLIRGLDWNGRWLEQLWWSEYWDSIGKDIFWRVFDKEERERGTNFAKETLALLAQGDKKTGQKAGLQLENGAYVLIPWLCPGSWNADRQLNEKPYTQKKEDMEAVFAYKTTVYDREGISEAISRYASVEFPNRYEKAAPPVLEMEVSANSPSDVDTRTVEYWVEEEVEEDGEKKTIRYKESITETLPSYPTQYRIIFPESTRMNWVEAIDTGEMAAASGGLGAVYYTENETEGEESSSSIRYNDGGSKNSLEDKSVEGAAMDAGVLYYGGHEVVVMITDRGFRLFKKSGDTYVDTGKPWIPLENLEQASSGYGLSIYGAETETDKSNDPHLQVTDEQDSIIRKNMERGIAVDIYSVSNMTLLNHKDIILSSLSGGLRLLNSENGLGIRLQTGAYYASFPYTDNGKRIFMAVGYDTEDYAYQPLDVVRAKCYSLDLEEKNKLLENEALKGYLDGLANDYLTHTHRLQWSQEKESYGPVAPTEPEKKTDQRAQRLFYQEETEKTNEELKAIASEFSFSHISADTVKYTADLKHKLQSQREALEEFYELAGLGKKAFPAEEVWLLLAEGELIHAQNTKTLENWLVELSLSDEAIGRIGDEEKKNQYKNYQTAMKAAEITNNQGTSWMPDEAADSGHDQQRQDLKEEYESGSQKKRQGIENTSFYDTVLEDIKDKYVQSEAPDGSEKDWDTYILELLKRISPDNSVSAQEQGLEELYQLTGFKEEQLPPQLMLEEMEGFRYVQELEELIVRKKVETAAYRTYRQDFKDYEETIFSTQEEKTETFQKSTFYQIITDLKEANAGLLEGTTWDKKLRDILGMCTGGIVLGSQNR